MSAFVVNNNHLDVLISYFIHPLSQYQLWTSISGEWGYLTQENAYKVAETLHQQNLKSVDFRYSEENPFEYEFKYISNARAFSMEEIAGAIDCLEYQSCETDDYYTTEAYQILCHMRKHLLQKLQDRAEEDGTGSFWEIENLKERSGYAKGTKTIHN